MLQAFPDLLFTLDESGTILDYKGSGAVSTLFATPEAFIGRAAADVLPPAFAESLRASLEALKAADGPVSFEYISQQAGGKRWFEARLVRSTDGRVIVVVRDATRHRRAEEKVRAQLGRMASLRAIDQTIASSRDLRLALSVVLSQVVAELKVDAADFLLLSEDNKLAFATGVGFRTEEALHRSGSGADGLAGRVMAGRQMVHVDASGIGTAPDPVSHEFPGEGFRCYYGMPLLAKGRARGVLEVFHRSTLEPDTDWLGFMEALAGQAAIAMENDALLQELQHTHLELTLAYDATIEGWARALDLRDRDTEDHTQRVAAAAVKLGRRMGLGDDELLRIRRGAVLHDIGKMAIPDSILLKSGPLTAEEWDEVRRHPRYAHELLSPIPYLADSLDIPRYHHERWDGTGYPYGLKGKAIPLPARLFAVIDVFDALTSPRPYRAGWDLKLARDYLRQEAGQKFDPEIVAEFIQMLEEDSPDASSSRPGDEAGSKP